MVLPRPSPLDTAHSLDWEILDLGHAPVSRRTVVLVDLDVYVHGVDEIAGSNRPIAVVLLSHGFANKAKQMWPMATGLILEAGRLDAAHPERVRTRDLLVVTLDQRNHGERRRVFDKASGTHGPTRLAGLAMSATGGRHDQELIMEYLADRLFPNGEREIVEYMSAGFSLGGHTTWRFLRDDPRVTVGVPIGSLPPAGLPEVLFNRWLPDGDMSVIGPGTRRFFSKEPAPAGTYKTKKILAIHGGQDAVLPYQPADAAWQAVAADAGHAARFVEEDKGHVVSPAMVIKAAEWFWYFGLTKATP